MADAHHTEGSGSGTRRTEEIEGDILSIRGRINRTLHELERRLSPGEMVSHVQTVADHVVKGTPHPVADAIRRNPVPIILIAAGLAWLGVEVMRGAVRDGKPHLTLPPDAVLSQDTADLLADLIGIARQGTKAMRQAGQALAEMGGHGRAGQVLRAAAEERGRTAALLQSELQRFGVPAVHGDAPTGDVMEEWTAAIAAVDSRDPAIIVSAVERAEDATRDRFRAAMGRRLPDSLRILVAGRFNEIERTHARVSALKHAYV